MYYFLRSALTGFALNLVHRKLTDSFLLEGLLAGLLVSSCLLLW